MYSPHLMNGNFLIMLSILPYHAMRFPCVIHYFHNILRWFWKLSMWKLTIV